MAAWLAHSKHSTGRWRWWLFCLAVGRLFWVCRRYPFRTCWEVLYAWSHRRWINPSSRRCWADGLTPRSCYSIGCSMIWASRRKHSCRKVSTSHPITKPALQYAFKGQDASVFRHMKYHLTIYNLTGLCDTGPLVVPILLESDNTIKQTEIWVSTVGYTRSNT